MPTTFARQASASAILVTLTIADKKGNAPGIVIWVSKLRVEKQMTLSTFNTLSRG
jgi:hypothetical protein